MQLNLLILFIAINCIHLTKSFSIVYQREPDPSYCVVVDNIKQYNSKKSWVWSNEKNQTKLVHSPKVSINNCRIQFKLKRITKVQAGTLTAVVIRTTFLGSHNLFQQSLGNIVYFFYVFGMYSYDFLVFFVYVRYIFSLILLCF